MTRSGFTSRRTAQGFTLIELLLAVVLVLLLTSALVFNFSNLLRGNHLEEGTTRVETLMRFARAQAANSGRKVQLVFGGEATNSPAASTGEVRATWEPDPLGQPGYFADLHEAHWHVQDINNLVQVESVKLLDASGAAPLARPGEEDLAEENTNAPAGPAMAPITFYPDGSSDSAEIILAARTAEDDQRMAVRLLGLTGSISHQLLLADYGAPVGELGPLERSGGLRRDGGGPRPSAVEQETTSRFLNSRPAVSSSRVLPKAPRATIGETNGVDLAE